MGVLKTFTVLNKVPHYLLIYHRISFKNALTSPKSRNSPAVSWSARILFSSVCKARSQNFIASSKLNSSKHPSALKKNLLNTKENKKMSSIPNN